MEEIVRWLMGLEKLAWELYAGAAEQFGDDPPFRAFLERLAADEASHEQLMARGIERLAVQRPPVATSVTIDETVRGHVEAPMRACLDLLHRGRLPKRDLVECMAAVEFSEWNDVFLYVATTLQPRGEPFQHVAASVQAHQNRIRKFIDELPPGERPSQDVGLLPTIWEEAVLVVDDEEPLRLLLARFLGKMGKAETAAGGREALDKIREGFFNAVVSDVEMPGMSGLELHEELVATDASAAGRFLLCSGNVTPEVEAYCRRHNVPWLSKPFRLDELRRKVQEIVEHMV